MKRIVPILALILTAFSLNGQVESPEFLPPMDIPLILSGNFGELRSDHFHSGIDIKTQGVTGIKVYAIQEGYVSRIKVQPGGYGLALYIDHPTGYTSVYGHLKSYNDTITSFVRNIQYARQSHSIDVYLKAGELPIQKGMLIGYSGNTGSSSGPHLHFEIRERTKQRPLNVLQYNFPVKDNRAPVFRHLIVYPLHNNSHVNGKASKQGFLLEKEGLNYRPKRSHVIEAYGDIGIGVEIYDYLNGANNRCGIFTLELQKDGETIFKSRMDGFLFSESRYINAHIDYQEKTEHRRSVQRLYLQPHNRLDIYEKLVNNGAFQVADTLEHTIRVIAEDVYGNRSELAFSIRGKKASVKHLDPSPGLHFVPYNEASSLRVDGVSLDFPAYSLYDDLYFDFKKLPGTEEFVSDIYQLHLPSVALHKRINVKIDVDPEKVPYPEKAGLYAIGNKGALSYAGGTYTDGTLSTQIRKLGNYAVAMDTLSPKILPVDLQKGQDLSDAVGIRFLIEDELSGIDSYQGYIDNRWVLFVYDPKNDMIFYQFDERVPKSGKNHEIELYIRDEMGNTATYRSEFYR